MEVAGVAIGVGALLLAFKGAVDSFVLIDAITEADNGQHFYALRYFIEKQKLQLWSDACKLDTPDASSLRHESEQTRKLIAAALAEIRALNQASTKYLKRYEMQQPEAHKKSDGDSMSLASVNAALIQATTNDRTMHRPVQRFLWAAKDKDKFAAVIERLRVLVSDLHELAKASSTRFADQGLPVYVVPNLTDPQILQALQQPDTDAGSLLSLSALLKQLQISPIQTTAVRKIPLNALGLMTNTLVSQQRDFRQICDLSDAGKLDRRVWVEWKSISGSLAGSDQEALEARITDLARLLCASKPPQYRVPSCLGLAEIRETGPALSALLASEPQARPKHFGFVYEYPANKFDELKPPVSLLELLQTSRQMPTLNDRISLARALASALSLLHASRWLHRGFRSSRVLFFYPNREPLNITDPYITGFEFSRPEVASASIETVLSGDQAIDMYYHPDTAKGFNRLRDYYSLGVVLFEIALWRSFEVKIPKDRGKALNKMDLGEIHRVLIDSIPALGSVVGVTYRDVVETCLKGAFGHQDDQDGAYLGRAFFRRVVQELERCSV